MCDHENDCMDWSDEDYFLCKVLDIYTSFALFPPGSLGSLRDLAELLVPFFPRCNAFAQTNSTSLATFAQTPCAENEFHCVEGDRYQAS